LPRLHLDHRWLFDCSPPFSAPAAHTNLPLAYFYNREMQKAFDEGQKAAEFNPRNILPRNNLVWYAMVLGKFDVAEKEYQ
jgi:Tfp pilus assembly protein PilF